MKKAIDMDPTPVTSKELPSELLVGRFAEARIKEILGLEAVVCKCNWKKAVKDMLSSCHDSLFPCSGAPRQGNAAHQQLPHHLRRRAVSHHPNRLPRRLRQRHLAARCVPHHPPYNDFTLVTGLAGSYF